MANTLGGHQVGVPTAPVAEGSTAYYFERLNEELNLLDNHIDGLANRAADYLSPEPEPTKVVADTPYMAQSENAARLSQIHGRLSYLSERLYSIIGRIDS